MKMIELLKQKLFSDEANQNALLAKIDDAINIDDALHKLFFEYKEHDLQKILAPFLRAATIKHMWEATTPWAQESKRVQIQEFGERRLLSILRSQNPRRRQKGLNQHEIQFHQLAINVYGVVAFDEYLQHQARDTIWGEDVDAASLADLLDITMIVTPVSLDSEGHYAEHLTYKVRECSQERPSIHCYNADGNHWFFYSKSYHETISDGNCLYNAFAQSLRQIILLEIQRSNKKELKQSINQHFSEKCLKMYTEQELLLQKFNQDNVTTLTSDELAKKITLQDGTSEFDNPELALALAESAHVANALVQPDPHSDNLKVENSSQPDAAPIAHTSSIIVQPVLGEQTDTLLQEIINRLKKEYLLEVKRHTLNRPQQLIFSALKAESLCTDDFLQQADTLQLKNNPLPIILKCIKAIHASQSSHNIPTQQLDELSNALTNIENAAPLYKQWYQFVSLVKHFIAQVGMMLGQDWSFDTTYRGPIRNQFWTESKEIDDVLGVDAICSLA